MDKLKLLFLSINILLLVGCATPIPLNEQSPQLTEASDNKVVVSVVDKRARLNGERSEAFIGVAHGAFGIPFDWHVNPVLATEPGDKERNLSEFLGHRIVTGLRKSGWDASYEHFTEDPNVPQARIIIEKHDASKLFVLELHEWFFSINLNWVSAFKFDTDATIYVYEMQNGQILEKRFKDRDIIDEKADESPQNNILRAYRDQLQEILTDQKVVGALRHQE